MNKEKALRLALEALEKLDKVMKRSPDTDKAIAAIKLALEQERALQALHDENERLGLYKDAYGQPEPVIDKSAAIRIATSLGWTPKREWQGLTDEDMAEPRTHIFDFIYGARWAEAKLKEKNT